jgi:probable rRNA maturation factor
VTDDVGDHPGPDPAILISDRQESTLDLDRLIRLASDTLMREGLTRVELSVSFVDEDEIADLHERYLHEPGPTDVLSFPLDPDDVERGERGGDVRVLGDVVIAPAVAASNNPSDPEAEVRLLLVHGILHLLGYDHEEEDERAEMWARQERYSGVTAS